MRGSWPRLGFRQDWALARWRVAVVLALLPMLSITACYPSIYKIDVFPEMHYQSSYGPQEPERQYPADQSVPISGKETTLSEENAYSLKNPVQQSEDTMKKATTLYKTNCAPCHGPTGHGDGIIAAYFRSANQIPPADYSKPPVTSRTDGELFYFITNGKGNMPPYSHLLTPEDRWTLVYFIRSVK